MNAALQQSIDRFKIGWDSTIVRIDKSIQNKLNAFEVAVEDKLNSIEPFVLRLENQWKSLLEEIESGVHGIQNTEFINYAVKVIILGAIIDMEDRIVGIAAENDWNFSSEEYDLMSHSSHIIAAETVDMSELDANVVSVKTSSGLQHVALSSLIGD